MSLQQAGKRVGLAGLIALSSAGISLAQISVDFRPTGPGSDDLVLEWVADGGLPAPFDLLRKVLPSAARPADFLPLDPGSDLYLTDVSSPLVLSRAIETDPADGMRLYQVVARSGGCSNVATLLQLRAFPTTPLLLASVPWRGGLRRTAQLLEDTPEAAGVIVITREPPLGRPLWRETRRLLDGSIGPEDFWIPPGAGIAVEFNVPGASVLLIGASEPSPRPLPAGGESPRDGPFSSILSLPLTASDTRVLTQLCGEEGTDWVDADGDECPEVCLGGLHQEGPSTTTLEQQVLGGDFAARQLFPDPPEAPLCTGSLIGSTWPGRALLEGTGRGPRSRHAFLPADLGATPACRCADSDGDGDDDCTELLIGTDPSDADSHGPDSDRDGRPDLEDNCPGSANPGQEDTDADGFGDACDSCPSGDAACEDADGDGIPYFSDNCPELANPDQVDTDGDWLGDACDPCPLVHAADTIDRDGDGLDDSCDNCPDLPNGDQTDRDADDYGDACDLCPDTASPTNFDLDGDGRGGACECNDADAGSWDHPLPVEDLRLTKGAGDRAELSWEDHSSELGPGLGWDLARGRLVELGRVGLAASASCRLADLSAPSFVESDAGSWWFLVREVNVCGPGPWRDYRTPSELDFSDPCR